MASPKHTEFSNFIKMVHHHLRIAASKVGFEEAWEEHCNDEVTLKEYAKVMHNLATEIWDERNKNDPSLSRIMWVYHQSLAYFETERLTSARSKESRLALAFNINLEETQNNNLGFKPPYKLLDVGSCYNPFKIFLNFETVAIDLMPATEDVKFCDFIKVPLVDNNHFSFDSSHPKCEYLPKNYFDVVVFSLFLEYIPSPSKRFECCSKAFNLLKPDGILVILTPDSSRRTSNVKLLKQWRYCLARIGFLRVVYEKLEHLHGLIFRKCMDPKVAVEWSNRQRNVMTNCDIIQIPQDFSDFMSKVENQSLEKEEKNEVDEEALASNFFSLPFSCPDE